MSDWGVKDGTCAVDVELDTDSRRDLPTIQPLLEAGTWIVDNRGSSPWGLWSNSIYVSPLFMPRT